MKDLPLSTFLPIMLETAEMSSDVDEEYDETFQASRFLPLTGHRTPPPVVRRPGGATGNESSRSTNRRCSLPSDRPPPTTSANKRNFNPFKARRKISAPGPQQPQPPPSVLQASPGTPNPNRHSPASPSGGGSGSPLIDLLDKLRPRQQTAATTDNAPASVVSRSRVHRRVSVDLPPFADTIDEGFHSGGVSGDDHVWKPLFVDTKLANTGNGTVSLAPATVPRPCLYYRQTSVIGGAPADHLQAQRQRSNSEAGISQNSSNLMKDSRGSKTAKHPMLSRQQRFLLMRKSSDYFGPTEVVGKLEVEWAYCQILASMKCCDLMPQLSKMVVIDADLSIRKAFDAFVHNNVRAAPIWDNQRQLFAGLLSATDLIRVLIQHFDEYRSKCTPRSSPNSSSSALSRKSSNSDPPAEAPAEVPQASSKSFDDLLNSPLHTWLGGTQRKDGSPKHSSSSIASSSNGSATTAGMQFNHMIYGLAEENVAKAAKLLCDRRLHRLVILDPDRGGNPLFLLTKKDILKGLQKYIAKLPLPACMQKTLEELSIGTWSNLVTVTPSTTLHEALSLFLRKGLSALPVVSTQDDKSVIVEMLTKVDVLKLVIEHKGGMDEILKMTVEDATKKRTEESEKMITCSKKATLLLAVECILHTNAHRLAIVDSDGKLEAIIALVDLLRFLTNGFICE